MCKEIICSMAAASRKERSTPTTTGQLPAENTAAGQVRGDDGAQQQAPGQYYYDSGAEGSTWPPEGVQMYIGDDGQPYYYYYAPAPESDGAQQPTSATTGMHGVTDDYDSDQNPMSEFYAAAAQGAAAAAAAGLTNHYGDTTQQTSPTLDANGAVRKEDVAATLLRTYEFEDWQPEHRGYFTDVVVELFFSLGFRLYFTFLMLCAGALIGCLSLSYTYAVLYRLFAPPVSGDNSSTALWTSMGYLSIFIFLSFTIVAVFCVWMDMMKGFWGATRKSVSLWGFSHFWITGESWPPIFIYTIVILLTIALPIAWGFIKTIADGQSVIYIASTYFYISIIVTMWLVAFCFVWFYWKALVEKKKAYARRFQSDDLREQRIINQGGHVERRVRSSWYYSESALEEYGLERRIVVWSAPVFIIGLVPIFSLLTSSIRDGRTDNPSPSWVTFGLIFLALLLILYQMTVSKNHAHRTVFLSIILILVMLILGLIGCAANSSGSMFALLFVLAGASQFLLLRKRMHHLTRKEVCALLHVALDREEVEERNEQQWDTYMCCCRNVVLAAIQWMDIKTLLGFRHPKVREFEKRIVIESPKLRSDYKVLLLWWLTVFACLVLVLAIGNTMHHTQWGLIATRNNASATTFSTQSPVCSLTFNTGGSSLTAVDLAMLAALCDSDGGSAEQNFATWFYQLGNFTREYPTVLPGTRKAMSTGNLVPFVVFHDAVTDFRVVVLTQQLLGAQMYQAVDYFGDSIALSAASVVGPMIHGWRQSDRRSFVDGSNFFRRALDSGFDPLSHVINYVTTSTSYANRNLIIVGQAFNGGYAKILGSRLGVPCLSFNGPGVASKMNSLVVAPAEAASSRGYEVVLTSSFLPSLIDADDAQDVDARFALQCPAGNSIVRCADIGVTVAVLLRTCGDRYGRGIQLP